MKTFFKKVWELIVKVWKWVVLSSTNANNLALTVQGFLYGLIPAILFIAGVYKWQVDSVNLTYLFDTVVSIIILIGGTVTGLMTAYGILRKIFLTLIGRNEVIKSFAQSSNNK